MKKSKQPPFVVESCSHYRQAPGRHPSPGRIAAGVWRIELVTHGRGWIEAGGEWREVVPGDLLWNHAGEFTIGRSDFEDPYHCLSLSVRGSGRRPADVARFTRAPDVEAARAFTREVVPLFQDAAPGREVVGSYAVGRLHLWAALHAHRERRESLPGPLQAAAEWIERNYRDRLPVTELARRSGWSPAHLHEMFRRHFGATPHQALLDRRLRAAQERLVSTLQPVKQVAFECGFANPSALAHLFRARLGTTPKGYRRRHLGLDG